MIDRAYMIEQMYRSLEPEDDSHLTKFAEMNKEALVFPLLANAGKFLSRFIGSGAKAVSPAASKALASGGTKAVAEGAEALAKPTLGSNIASLTGFGTGVGTWGDRMATPLRMLPGLGREGATRTLGFGLTSGALGAAMPEEGGSRWESAAKGFGRGLLSGAGWEYGAKGFGSALKRLNPNSTFGKAKDLDFEHIWDRTSGSNMAKLMGAKSLMGVGGVAAGLGGSYGLEHLYDKAKTMGEPKKPFLGFDPKSPGGMFGATSGTTPSGVQGGF